MTLIPNDYQRGQNEAFEISRKVIENLRKENDQLRAMLKECEQALKNCDLQNVSNPVRQEVERRRDLIISEPDGIVRETMIRNLAIDL